MNKIKNWLFGKKIQTLKLTRKKEGKFEYIKLEMKISITTDSANIQRSFRDYYDN